MNENENLVVPEKKQQRDVQTHKFVFLIFAIKYFSKIYSYSKNCYGLLNFSENVRTDVIAYQPSCIV